MYIYDRPYSPADFNYILMLNTEHPDYETFTKTLKTQALAELQNRFSINVHESKLGENITIDDSKETYIAIAPVDLLALSTVQEDAIRRLSQHKNARVNIIPLYKLPQDAESLKLLKEKLNRKTPVFDTHNKVNTMYPNTEITDNSTTFWTVSPRNLVDNFICDSVRIKYNAIKVSNAVRDGVFLDNASVQIKQIASIHREYGLWHKAKTDGTTILAFDDKYFVTQTFTDKTTLTNGSFSQIHNWDEEKNTIEYSGPKLPSSDSADLLVFFDMIRKEQAYSMLIHFHKNSITRNPEFSDYTTNTEIEYGTFESAKKLVDEFGRIGGNWFVLKEHGVVWLGNTVEEFANFIRKICLEN